MSCILRGGYTSLARLIVSLTGPKAVNGYQKSLTVEPAIQPDGVLVAIVRDYILALIMLQETVWSLRVKSILLVHRPAYLLWVHDTIIASTTETYLQLSLSFRVLPVFWKPAAFMNLSWPPRYSVWVA